MREGQTWYAVYTTPRAEKKISERLSRQGIDHYLPMLKTLRHWSDRKKWVDEPLFKSYLFVHISPQQQFTVLNTQGVVKFVSFEGKHAPIPDSQIDLIRKVLREEKNVETSQETLDPGTPVEITTGPLMGTLGELVSFRGERRLAIKIQTLETSVLLNIPEQWVERIQDPKKLELLDSLSTPKFER